MPKSHDAVHFKFSRCSCKYEISRGPSSLDAQFHWVKREVYAKVQIF